MMFEGWILKQEWLWSGSALLFAYPAGYDTSSIRWILLCLARCALTSIWHQLVVLKEIELEELCNRNSIYGNFVFYLDSCMLAHMNPDDN